MQPNDTERFSACILAVSETYRTEFSTPTVEVWRMALSPYRIESVEQALAEHISDPEVGRFAPKPADLIRRIAGISDDVALRAWTKFYSALCSRRHGLAAFDDAVLHAVIDDMGGHRRFNIIYERDLPFIKREFCTRYLMYLRRQEQFEYPTELLLSGDLRDRPISLIGDPRRAREVLEGRALTGVPGLEHSYLGRRPRLVELEFDEEPADELGQRQGE